MLKEAVFTSICVISISGCALTENSDLGTENQAAAAPASNPQPVLSANPSGVALPETPSADAEKKNVTPAYVKEIQTHLKRAGFYSGAVDGIVGTRTQAAIRHFQSGCVSLKDLISIPDPAALQESSVMADKAAIAKIQRGPAEEVRLMQLRLKDAGFNPGPIDGIDGRKTQAALLALQSGCKMLDNVQIMPLGSVHTLLPDGLADVTRASDLSRSVTVAGKNSSREAITALQHRLSESGFDPGPIDGILGPRTKAAVQRYQLSLR